MPKKRAVILARQNGFDKVSAINTNRVSCKNSPELRYLRWDQAMLKWPNYDNQKFNDWLKENEIALKKNSYIYYKNKEYLFKHHGWSPEDLYNTLLWHCFIYVNTPALSRKTNGQRIWAHVKQRALEIYEVLGKDFWQNKEKVFFAINDPNYEELLGTQSFDIETLTFQKGLEILSELNLPEKLYKSHFFKKMLEKLRKIQDDNIKKVYLKRKLRYSRHKDKRKIIETLLNII